MAEDKKLKALCEVIGSFFVDRFYNDLYDRARSAHLHQNKFDSITDSYREHIRAYVHGFSEGRENYKKTIEQLKEYYNAIYYTEFSLTKLVDVIVSKFVPDEYFSSMSSNAKDIILWDLLKTTLQDFSAKVINPKILNDIIGNHANEANINMLQNMIYDSLMDERANIFKKFIVKKRENDEERLLNPKIKQLMKVVTEKTKENYLQQQQLDNAKQMAQVIFAEKKELEKQLEELQNKYDKLNKQHNELKNEYNSLKKNNSVKSTQIKKNTRQVITKRKKDEMVKESKSTSESADENIKDEISKNIAKLTSVASSTSESAEVSEESSNEETTDETTNENDGDISDEDTNENSSDESETEDYEVVRERQRKAAQERLQQRLNSPEKKDSKTNKKADNKETNNWLNDDV